MADVSENTEKKGFLSEDKKKLIIKVALIVVVVIVTIWIVRKFIK